MSHQRERKRTVSNDEMGGKMSHQTETLTVIVDTDKHPRISSETSDTHPCQERRCKKRSERTAIGPLLEKNTRIQLSTFNHTYNNGRKTTVSRILDKIAGMVVWCLKGVWKGRNFNLEVSQKRFHRSKSVSSIKPRFSN